MIFRKTSFLLVPASLLFISCLLNCQQTNDHIEDEPIPFENSKLEVQVEMLTDTGRIDLEGAVIRLYAAQEYLEEEYKAIYVGTTDSTGTYRFSALAHPAYYISVKSPVSDEVQVFYDGAPFPTPGHPVQLNTLPVLFTK